MNGEVSIPSSSNLDFSNTLVVKILNIYIKVVAFKRNDIYTSICDFGWTMDLLLHSGVQSLIRLVVIPKYYDVFILGDHHQFHLSVTNKFVNKYSNLYTHSKLLANLAKRLLKQQFFCQHLKYLYQSACI